MCRWANPIGSAMPRSHEDAIVPAGRTVAGAGRAVRYARVQFPHSGRLGPGPRGEGPPASPRLSNWSPGHPPRRQFAVLAPDAQQRLSSGGSDIQLIEAGTPDTNVRGKRSCGNVDYGSSLAGGVDDVDAVAARRRHPNLS